MRLVVQCAVCGTHHPVGTVVCTTCKAMGIQNLRLMFECPVCFHLGILPACEVCTPLLPYEVVEDDEAKPADANLPDEFILNIEDDPLLDFESDDGVFPLDDD